MSVRRAGRPGALPSAGSVLVGGIELPVGARWPEGDSLYWVTDEPVWDVATLAGSLADVFPLTGLWPVLWQWPDEGPESYMRRRHLIDDDDVEGIAAEVFRLAWPDAKAQSRLGRPWTDARPPMAVAATPLPGRQNPYRALMTEPMSDWERDPRLVLIPCRRPADVLARTGWDYSNLAPPLLAAVLRSWEDRFAAHLVALDPSGFSIHVAAPPTDPEQALALAYELLAIAYGGTISQLPEELAKALIGTGPDDGFCSELWQLSPIEDAAEPLHELATSIGWKWPPPLY